MDPELKRELAGCVAKGCLLPIGVVGAATGVAFYLTSELDDWVERIALGNELTTEQVEMVRASLERGGKFHLPMSHELAQHMEKMVLADGTITDDPVAYAAELTAVHEFMVQALDDGRIRVARPDSGTHAHTPKALVRQNDTPTDPSDDTIVIPPSYLDGTLSPTDLYYFGSFAISGQQDNGVLILRGMGTGADQGIYRGMSESWERWFIGDIDIPNRAIKSGDFPNSTLFTHIATDHLAGLHLLDRLDHVDDPDSTVGLVTDDVRVEWAAGLTEEYFDEHFRYLRPSGVTQDEFRSYVAESDLLVDLANETWERLRETTPESVERQGEIDQAKGKLDLRHSPNREGRR